MWAGLVIVESFEDIYFKKKVPSEMEDRACTLSTLFILFTVFTLFTLFILILFTMPSIAHTVYTVYTYQSALPDAYVL